MPKVWSEVKFRGEKGEVIRKSLANSGASLTVLTPDILDAIKPKALGKTKVVLATGEKIDGEVYLVGVEILDERRKEWRKCEDQAVVIGKREYPLLGVSSMEKLKVSPSVQDGKLIFH